MATNMVANSAIGIANQTPLIPNNAGNTNSETTMNKRVRANETIAEVFPSDKAVK